MAAGVKARNTAISFNVLCSPGTSEQAVDLQFHRNDLQQIAAPRED
jgi:hypothetical protein